jgi:hypothetical protein
MGSSISYELKSPASTMLSVTTPVLHIQKNRGVEISVSGNEKRTIDLAIGLQYLRVRA